VEVLGDNAQRARDELAVFRPKQLGIISAPDSVLEIGPIKVHCCVPFGTPRTAVPLKPKPRPS